MTDEVGRRALLKAMPGMALGGTIAPAAKAAEPALAVPALSLAMRLRVLIGEPRELGMVDGVRKRIIPITGGTVEGPRLEGKVLAGGADWQSIRKTRIRFMLRPTSASITQATAGRTGCLTGLGCRAWLCSM